MLKPSFLLIMIYICWIGFVIFDFTFLKLFCTIPVTIFGLAILSKLSQEKR